MKYNKSELPKTIRELAEYLDDYGNSGSYAKNLPHTLNWVLRPEYKPYRDGILYYSRGHGWRVRKHPHWREVWQERFTDWEEL